VGGLAGGFGSQPHWSRGCVRLFVRATGARVFKYGPLQLSGNVETYNLVRHPNGETFQFIKNRNTPTPDRFGLGAEGQVTRPRRHSVHRPSNVFLLYRGWYDSFYDIEPGWLPRWSNLEGRQGRRRIGGNGPGNLDSNGNLKSGGYSRYNEHNRTALKRDKLAARALRRRQDKGCAAELPRRPQQVIWGESDLFRMLDMWNPSI